MDKIFDLTDFPKHLFQTHDLSFANKLTAPVLAKPWFCLAECSQSKNHDLEVVLERQTMLVGRDKFKTIHPELHYTADTAKDLGQPQAYLSDTRKTKYNYQPFYEYRIAHGNGTGEPIGFLCRNLGRRLFLNPDVWMFLELEEKAQPNRLWFDPQRHVEVIKHNLSEESETIEIRTEYLQKYLRYRQKALLVSEYSHLHLFNPKEDIVRQFETGEESVVNKTGTAKVVFQSYGPRKHGSGTHLQRRMHLWWILNPQKINLKDPWSEPLDFDLASFTLPTREGRVAPARFLHSQVLKHKFAGGKCDFMDRVYFKQAVLEKYQNLAGFEIDDDGAVRNQYFWSFDRSAQRIGNDYLAIAIGDFAEGVSFHEWTHWGFYAVDPPSDEYFERMKRETSIVDTVNLVYAKLQALNAAFRCLSDSRNENAITSVLWRGKKDSLPEVQLKWFYSDVAQESEFLKRATLLSTWVIDELDAASMRQFLSGRNLSMILRQIHIEFSE
jgi:hypothetical protein